MIHSASIEPICSSRMIDGSETLTIVASMMTIEMPSPMNSIGSQRIAREDGGATLTDDMPVTLGPGRDGRSRASDQPAARPISR